ncbi:MAG: hypothetical protein JXA71_16925 [Chitinispirillaceae bacterium]|nr:hypothetical protein [Chitinispirillaceae bacterium]
MNRPVKETCRNDDLENWCELIDCENETRFLERVKSTGILTHPYHFNIYLRRRMPDKSLKHVHTWKNTLPDPDDIGITFGGGKAVIDFEVLPGRYGGNKKRGIRVVMWFHESYDEKKKENEYKALYSR